LRNECANGNHWLGITLVGAKSSATAVGAKVTLEAGGCRQVRVNQWATSYLSFNDPRIHFGLGKQDRVDRLEVRWAGGNVEVYRDLRVDRYLTIVEGKGIRREGP
jgi:hypothetical protein